MNFTVFFKEGYAIILFLTIIIELSVIFLIGFRSKKLFTGLIIVNILTNPLLNFIVRYFNFDFTQILISEVIVTITEALFLKLFIRDKEIPYFGISFIANVSSFLAGLWLPLELLF